MDNNPKHMVETFKAAHQHKGISFVEIFQNCVIFNDSTWESIYGKDNRDEQMLFLETGKPLLFGKNKAKGIRLNGLTPEVVDAASAAPGEILVHQPGQAGPLYSHLLATMGQPDFPTPMGVIRQVEKPTYESLVHDQIAQAQAKRGTGTWQELLHGNSTWTVA